MAPGPRSPSCFRITLAVQLSVCIFAATDSLARLLEESLSLDRFAVARVSSPDELARAIEGDTERIDCLVLQAVPELAPLLQQLSDRGRLLPTAIVESESDLARDRAYVYHSGEVRLPAAEAQEIVSYVDKAVTQYLQLPADRTATEEVPPARSPSSSFLTQQQKRLTEKLRERLGYLGVYYKRNPQDFLRHLSWREKEQLLNELRAEYRHIALNYFSKDSQVNAAIDRFVNRAFFADIAVTQIMEIHMELMEEFAQQLRLEGRSDEILIDYRLTLIDVVAHLCEMYRRSIPREELIP